jgi:hypothetical protein
MTEFTEVTARTSRRRHGQEEIDALLARRDELLERLANDRSFYSARNEDGHRRSARHLDQQLCRFLDPAIRNDRALTGGYSAALSIVRDATEVANTQVRPRLVEQWRANLNEVAHRCAEIGALRTKDERRRRARMLIESELGFPVTELVEELVDAVNRLPDDG